MFSDAAAKQTGAYRSSLRATSHSGSRRWRDDIISSHFSPANDAATASLETRSRSRPPRGTAADRKSGRGGDRNAICPTSRTGVHSVRLNFLFSLPSSSPLTTGLGQASDTQDRASPAGRVGYADMGSTEGVWRGVLVSCRQSGCGRWPSLSSCSGLKDRPSLSGPLHTEIPCCRDEKQILHSFNYHFTPPALAHGEAGDHRIAKTSGGSVLVKGCVLSSDNMTVFSPANMAVLTLLLIRLCSLSLLCA